MKSRHGARVRFLCRTPLQPPRQRLPPLATPRRTLDQFAALLTEGLSFASLARTLHVWPNTISRWLAHAAMHARAFGDVYDRIDHPLEFQLDEISARPAT
jgi:hypothetical protein